MVEKGEGSEQASVGRTNRFLEERQMGFPKEQTGNDKVCDKAYLWRWSPFSFSFLAMKLPQKGFPRQLLCLLEVAMSFWNRLTRFWEESLGCYLIYANRGIWNIRTFFTVWNIFLGSQKEYHDTIGSVCMRSPPRIQHLRLRIKVLEDFWGGLNQGLLPGKGPHVHKEDYFMLSLA